MTWEFEMHMVNWRPSPLIDLSAAAALDADTLDADVCREAFAEIYAGRASQMAEHMGRLRRKEAAKREGFKKNVVHLIPQQLLTRLGLEVQPPHCQIHLPNTPSQLPHVTAEDLKRVPLPAEASSVGARLKWVIVHLCAWQGGVMANW